MPKVGDKEFPYTPEGMKNAKQESSATGVPMQDANERTQNFQLGGEVPGQPGFGVNPNQPQAPGTVAPLQGMEEGGEVGEEGGEAEKYKWGGLVGLKERMLEAKAAKGEKGGTSWLGANPFKKGIFSGRKSSGSWLDRIRKLKDSSGEYTGRHADTVNAPAEVPEVAPPVEAPEVAPEVPMEAPELTPAEVPGIVPEEEAPVEAADSDYVSGREEFAKGGKVGKKPSRRKRQPRYTKEQWERITKSASPKNVEEKGITGPYGEKLGPGGYEEEVSKQKTRKFVSEIKKRSKDKGPRASRRPTKKGKEAARAGRAKKAYAKGGKVKKDKKGLLDKLGEKIAAKLIGQDPKTGEIPKPKGTPKIKGNPLDIRNWKDLTKGSRPSAKKGGKVKKYGYQADGTYVGKLVPSKVETASETHKRQEKIKAERDKYVPPTKKEKRRKERKSKRKAKMNLKEAYKHENRGTGKYMSMEDVKKKYGVK